MNIFYLHGFASGPQSKKADFFRERLAPYGIPLQCPDFNEPDFASLTLTRMLGQVSDRIVATTGPVVLIGSSLGATVAVLTAERMPDRIDRLVLLAPALMFPRDAPDILGREAVTRWRETGVLDVFHHGLGQERRLNYEFYEDGMRYDAFAAAVRQPSLIVQGLRDGSVDHRVVERYAAGKSNVRLILVDDDHQLLASLPRIWSEMTPFLELS